MRAKELIAARAAEHGIGLSRRGDLWVLHLWDGSEVLCPGPGLALIWLDGYARGVSAARATAPGAYAGGLKGVQA